MKKIGLFYATKAERTSWVAEKIQKEFGEGKVEVVAMNRHGRMILQLTIVLLLELPRGLTVSCLLIGMNCYRSFGQWN